MTEYQKHISGRLSIIGKFKTPIHTAVQIDRSCVYQYKVFFPIQDYVVRTNNLELAKLISQASMANRLLFVRSTGTPGEGKVAFVPVGGGDLWSAGRIDHGVITDPKMLPKGVLILALRPSSLSAIRRGEQLTNETERKTMQKKIKPEIVVGRRYSTSDGLIIHVYMEGRADIYNDGGGRVASNLIIGKDITEGVWFAGGYKASMPEGYGCCEQMNDAFFEEGLVEEAKDGRLAFTAYTDRDDNQVLVEHCPFCGTKHPKVPDIEMEYISENESQAVAQADDGETKYKGWSIDEENNSAIKNGRKIETESYDELISSIDSWEENNSN